MAEFHEQLKVIRNVAAQYWQQDISHISYAIQKIQVIKRTPGRVSGFLPDHENFPAVFFKVYFKDYGYKFEHKGLKTANHMSQIEGVRVPKIIRIYPDYKAFLLEKRTWKDSNSEIKRFFIQYKNYHWQRIGDWLRHFHDMEISTSKNENFLNWKFDKTNRQLDKLLSLFSQEEHSKIQKIIREAKIYYNQQPCEWVLAHGDFGLSNIKVSKKKIIDIIDFEDAQIAPREFDILNCMVRMEYLECFPNQKNSFKQIFSQFITGYGIKLELTPSYKFLYLFIKLDILESYHRRFSQRSQLIYKRLLYSYLYYQLLKRFKKWLNTIS